MTRTIEFRTLHCFVEVAREGSVSHAAVRLHLSQPAVSLQLKNLAKATGLALFRRTHSGLTLTADGCALLVKAEQVLSTMHDFDRTAHRLTRTVRGKLKIGTIIDPDFTRLGQFLSQLVAAAPDLTTELSHGMSGDVPERLLRGDIDVGFYLGDLTALTRSVQRRAYFGRPLTQCTYRVVAPAGWERRVADADWKHLAALPWISTPPASVHHRLLADVFEKHNVKQCTVALVDQEPSMLAMVKSGIGLCLCRDSVALHAKQTSGLVIAETAELTTTLSFLTLLARKKDAAVALSLEVIERLWPRR